MNNTQYLRALDSIEGKGDNWAGAPKTSEKYGITNDALEQVSRAIRKRENGDYTETAKSVRNLLSPKLLKKLESKIVWKNNDMKSHATLDDVKRFGVEGYAELALALRQDNKNLIKRDAGFLREDDLDDRICLTLHNKPALRKTDEFKELYACGTTNQINHYMMTTGIDATKEEIRAGIKKRRFAVHNRDWETVPVEKAMKDIDKNVKDREDLIAKINASFDREDYYFQHNNNVESINQAFCSQYRKKQEAENPGSTAKKFPNEDRFVNDLLGNGQVSMQNADSFEQKRPENESFLQKLGRIGMQLTNPMYWMANQAMENQVAKTDENILENDKGTKNELGIQNNNLQ